MRSSLSCLCCLLICGSVALGQEPRPKRYFPLNTPLPPTGRAGDWGARINRGNPARFQPVEIQLPVAGQVTWYGSKGQESALTSAAPSMAGLLLGPVYRLKLSDMADYPGVELYPSIEMVDRLHPPAGREAEFPVIIPFTEGELNAAAQGRLVTKVIYLEQPNRASFQTAGRGKAVAPLQISPRENPLQVADIQGRPLAIVRLGGRVPDTNRPEPGFYGAGAPVQAIQPVVPAPATTQTEVDSQTEDTAENEVPQPKDIVDETPIDVAEQPAEDSAEPQAAAEESAEPVPTPESEFEE